MTSISLMEKMEESAPDLAMSTEQAILNMEKFDALADQGLLQTRDGRVRYLRSRSKRAQLLLDRGRNELARDAAAQEVKDLLKFGFRTAPTFSERRYVLRAYRSLVKGELASSNAEGVLAAVAEMQKILAAENERADLKSHQRTSLINDLAWALYYESWSLAQLGQFDLAVERAHQHLEAIHTFGEYEGHRRYLISASLMCIVLEKWNEAGGADLEQYQQAKTDALQFLETGFDDGVTPTVEWLSHSYVDMLRDDERFDAIVERARTAEN